jgi:hypothetical protein
MEVNVLLLKSNNIISHKLVINSQSDVDKKRLSLKYFQISKYLSLKMEHNPILLLIFTVNLQEKLSDYYMKVYYPNMLLNNVNLSTQAHLHLVSI